MTAKMNMKSWYTMRMLKTFFKDVTTQSKTACGEERHSQKTTGYQIWGRRVWVCDTLSLGSLLMVLRGRRTLRTLRDLIVLMSRPLLFLSTVKCGDQSHCWTCKISHSTDSTDLKKCEINKEKKSLKKLYTYIHIYTHTNIYIYIYIYIYEHKKYMNSTGPSRCYKSKLIFIFVLQLKQKKPKHKCADLTLKLE